jgi:ElaB/YqjD/DUF883 family membrane-anchored ribosome-binding protein
MWCPAAAHREESYVTDATFGSTDDTGSTTDQVKDQVRDKAQMGQNKTRGALGQARGRLSEQVDQRSTQAGERLSGQAADARSIAEELRSQGKDAPATMVEQVAGQADRVGEYLKGASGDRILRDVEDFARRQPWLVAASGLVLGFAASRFMKASSSRRYESGYGDLDRSYAREPLYGTSSYRTSPYDTSATVGTTAGYGTEASYAPVSDAPVGGTYETDPVGGETLRDVYDERRS